MTGELITQGKSTLPVEREQLSLNPALVYLASLQGAGRRGMHNALSQVAGLFGRTVESMDWAGLEYEHLMAIRTKLSDLGYKPATINHRLAGVRGVLRAAYRMRLITSEQFTLTREVGLVRGSTLPAGRAVKGGELAAIMQACAQDESAAGRRDAAIIAIAYAAGLRRAELAGLRLDNINPLDDELIELRLTGKGNKERTVYLNNGSAAALRDYLQVRGAVPGALFYSGVTGGRLRDNSSMTPQAIRNVIVKRAAQAGADTLTPHDLRRSFVSDLLDAGVDIATVSRMAGHSNVQTTARYDRRGEQAKQQASRALKVPYLKG